jgi:putative FmdB family regulatory protein
MPTYQFACLKCDAIQTETIPIAMELPIPHCPNCQTLMTRIYQAPGIVFQGKGWGKDQ